MWWFTYGSFSAYKDKHTRTWQRRALKQLLRHTRGYVTKAARLAKMDRANFYRLMRELSIELTEAPGIRKVVAQPQRRGDG